VTFDHHVLLWLVFLPLAAGIFVGALGPQRAGLVRWVSLGVSAVILVLALVLAGRFIALERTGVHTAGEGATPTFHPEFVPGSTPGDRHRTQWDIVPVGTTGAVQFYLGVDGVSIWLVVLTALLLLPSVLISWTHVSERVNEFFAWLLVLQTCMMGIFVAFDILLFYVFFELSLVPLFFLIGIWGGPQRQFAARKFFLYTLTGSLLTLLGVLAVVQACLERRHELTFSIPRLVELVHLELASPETDVREYWGRLQNAVFLLLTAGFAVKVPLFPFHTWLPLAHVEAPTAGSVDLAGILLKVGAYGFLRLGIPLAPDASLSFGLPVVTTLAAIGIVYGAWCAYSQEDIKRLVAYSSISHLGLAMLAMFTLNLPGLEGSLMQMFNHGLSTGGLFLLVGMIYERYHTRRIGDFGGMAARMPLFAVLFVFMVLSSAGLPGLNGFIGEYLCLSGIAQHDWQYGKSGILTFVAATGLVWGAWYLLTMVRRLLYGPLKEPHIEGHAAGDLKPREWLLLVPPVVMCVLIGVYPRPILASARPDLETVVSIADHARRRVGLPPSSEPATVPADRRGGTEGVP
jgi:NADH-quinone oxidoreductase subunit M